MYATLFRKCNRDKKTLFDLGQQITAIYPTIKTKNPYKKLVQKVTLSPLFDNSKTEELLKLFDLLVHSFTTLNHIYRRHVNYTYISEREDNMLALQLLSKEAFPHTVIGKAARKTYREILDIYGTEQSFTSYEIRFKLRKPETTLRRHFKELLASENMELLGGSRYGGYVYRLKELTEVYQNFGKGEWSEHNAEYIGNYTPEQRRKIYHTFVKQ